MDDLEERARKRLELEDVRQRRVALELELEARRKAAEAAQQKLAQVLHTANVCVYMCVRGARVLAPLCSPCMCNQLLNLHI